MQTSKRGFKPAAAVAMVVFVLSLIAPKASLASSLANYLVISEIQIDSIVGSGGASDDFIELYNPTNSAVDLSGYSIQKQTQGGSITKISLSGFIPAYGFFLIVRDSFDTDENLKALADVLASNFQAASNNSFYLVSNQDTIIGSADSDIVDLVGTGTNPNFEGTAAAPNLGEAQSLERKSGEIHQADKGNGWDSNENSTDFFVQDQPNPQNTQSNPETPEASEPEEPPIKNPTIIDELNQTMQNHWQSLKQKFEALQKPKKPQLPDWFGF